MLHLLDPYRNKFSKDGQDEWTGSIAVGNKSFIENVKARLGFRAKRREVINVGEGYHLRESSASYKTLFGVEDEDIDLQNTYFWAVNVE